MPYRHYAIDKINNGAGLNAIPVLQSRYNLPDKVDVAGTM